MPKNIDLAEHDTYVFIDASNIRSACLKTLGLRLDFFKLMQLLKKQCINLKDVRYYEGASPSDRENLRRFRRLEHVGYTIRYLVRRTYANIKKSNVDVYLASELLEIALLATNPTKIVLYACDGDYAEMIRVAVKNELVKVAVVAPPMAKNLRLNSLSTRLIELESAIPRYRLVNIEDVADLIKE